MNFKSVLDCNTLTDWKKFVKVWFEIQENPDDF